MGIPAPYRQDEKYQTINGLNKTRSVNQKPRKKSNFPTLKSEYLQIRRKIKGGETSE